MAEMAFREATGPYLIGGDHHDDLRHTSHPRVCAAFGSGRFGNSLSAGSSPGDEGARGNPGVLFGVDLPKFAAVSRNCP